MPEIPTAEKSTGRFSLRLRIALVSLLSFVVTTACAVLRQRVESTPEVLCYAMITPTDTPTPIVECYIISPLTETPTPTLTCYTATPSHNTPDPIPTCYTPTLPSPPTVTASPTLTPTLETTPTVTCYVPPADVNQSAPARVPILESRDRRQLLQRLLTEERFPPSVAEGLGDLAGK
ncbi:MAG TPA: hypothetical protein ENN99_12195 [Chloroflexi bacterium]|nr:hypothetical protein [Chloroflexota bacterium]